MDRNKLLAVTVFVGLLFFCTLFLGVTFTFVDPKTQLSLPPRVKFLQPTPVPTEFVPEVKTPKTPIPPPVSIFCQKYSGDQQYLYQLKTAISTKSDGTETFTSTRPSDGLVLRRSFDTDEDFFVDRSGGDLDISYDIVDQCGGVDIVYTIRNTTGEDQRLPRLQVEGITQTTTGDFYVLDTKDTGFVRKVGINIKDGTHDGDPLTTLYGGGCCNYPGFYYSPVMVTYDSDFAVGSSLMYPYMQYQHTIAPRITKGVGAKIGTWTHEYIDFKVEEPGNGNPDDAVMGNGVRKYTISLRFTEPRSWLLTLAPYKTYFKKLYGNVKQVRPLNQDIVEANFLANISYISEANPRGWTNAPLMSTGWAPFIDRYIAGTQTRDIKRTMIWAPSGMYLDLEPCRECNYPSHFMSFLPVFADTVSEFVKFAQNEIELGFWWGNSSYIPVPDQWNPTDHRIADFSNLSDRAFLDDQILRAYRNGARTVGMDAFDGTTYDKSLWIDHLKEITNNQILFVHETSGPDILHQKIANFYHPTSYTWWWQYDKLHLNGPDVLSRYLNDGAEIWFQHDVVPPYGSTALYEQSYSWGFTPVIGQSGSNSNFRVSNLRLSVVKCFDKIDNDGDGDTDWPYDRGCTSALSNVEGGTSGAQRESLGL